MIRLIINGINGKMGQAILSLAQAQSELYKVVAGSDYKAMQCESIPVYKHISEVREQADVVIDFSRPDALQSTLAFAEANNMSAVIGTTGLTDAHRSQLAEYSKHIAVFESGNMSIGVNLQIELVKKAAAVLGEKYDVEIIEKHHNTKVDAPSGTALMLADAINSQFGNSKRYAFGRHCADQARSPSEIGIHSLRGGTLVGEHQVHFIGEDEVVEITHYAYSKRLLAAGALRAASFIHGKAPGLYGMSDIFNW